ncbi:MAG: M20/M25/M40 family metallo-hydrolase [Gemmatimonadaceae bacterium]|nr:M20/M25/M40 family metallo-hydrolase [Gemmatimonadaceae bacterium]
MRISELSLADREAVLWECIGHLQALIRIESVNPPGNEIGVARYLHDVLQKAGIGAQLLEPAPGRGAVIARIHGTGRKGALLLMAHMDVVGVERDKWRQHPFSGEIADGYVYGRGAIDDKGMLATNLQAMLLWQRAIEATGERPDRDLVFLATSDEEAGGRLGIQWVLDHHRDDIAADVALNEGGRVRQRGGQRLYAAVQCAEKVPYNVVVTARGPGGHASVPLAGNAIARLSRAVARIAEHEEPLRLTPVTREFFRSLSVIWPDEALREAMADVASDDQARVSRGAARLRQDPGLDATLRNGISPTLITGGLRSNVIPTEASATLNVRMLPDEPLADLIARLTTVCDDPAIEFTVRSSGRVSPSSAIDTEAFAAIRRAVERLDPGLITVPYLSTGATDSAALREAGIACYGLLPFPLTEGDESRMHGHDERVGVDAIGFGLWLTCAIVEELS